MARCFSRRDFIKISGLGLGGMTLGSSLLQSCSPTPAGVTSLSGLVQAPVSLSPTTCEICFWQCAGWVHQRNGEPWKITGNADDPNCEGRLCPRGTGGLGAYTDPDRLQTPLIRVNGRGGQTFREASWEEALDYIAQRMQRIADRYGPEAIALFSHGSGGVFFKHLLRAYGSNTLTAPSYAQCRGPREEAYKLTFGEGIGSPERTDLRNSKCIVLIGSHLGENMHNTQVQEFAQAIGNGASVITVDPRFSTAASKSKYWLPIKPATDTALLLAWINVIIEEELYDKDFVAAHTVGLDKLTAAVAQNTPEWAYPITTIKPGLIRETAREMARHKPATLIHPGRHVTWYGDDTQRVRAGAILNALLGSWGRRGGYYYPVKAEIPGYPYPKYPEYKSAVNGEAYPFASLTLANEVVEASIPTPEQAAKVHGWLVYGTNLILTLPDPAKTLQAIQELDLMVAVDLMPAEITGWADVVLPECSYLERYDDLRISQGRVPSVAFRAPAFKPKYNSKPGWWMARELGVRIGLQRYFPWENIETYLDMRLQLAGLSLEKMQEKGVLQLDSQQPLFFEDGMPAEFDTPSGKIELYSELLAGYGFDAVPKYEAHATPPPGYFRLIYGRAPMHTFGRTINNPLLNELMSENTVWLNQNVATRYGLKSGDSVVLVNQDGVRSNPIKVKVTERIRKDCVYMVHGFGRTDKRLSKSFLRGADDNGLITRVKVDPLMGGTGMRVNFVALEAA